MRLANYTKPFSFNYVLVLAFNYILVFELFKEVKQDFVSYPISLHDIRHLRL